jgi:threonine dehydratase
LDASAEAGIAAGCKVVAEEFSARLVREAAERIRPFAYRTPVVQAGQFFFKCENLQRGGAFKIRGAANRILSIPTPQRERGVVAFSSGNHAQAAAIVAEQLGIQAIIVMPSDAPRSKMEATREHGARIVTYDRLTEDREEIAGRILEETGGTLVPPYNHHLIMAGAGTAALELLEEVPELDAMVVCVGGGGFISGSATIARDMNPAIRVFGAEPERANDVWQSLRAGKRITIPPPDTIADGLRTLSPGELTFPVIQELVEEIFLIGEDEILDAMRQVLYRLKLLVEPSGAVSAAAALFGKLPADLKRVGVLLSGGNVDVELVRNL